MTLMSSALRPVEVKTESRNAIVLFVERSILASAYCTVATIVRHLPKNTIVQLFCVDLSETEFDLAQAAFSKFRPAVVLVQVESISVFGDIVERSCMLGMGVWGRLFLDLLLPSDLSRVLYVDCDMLVYRDLSDLFETKFPAGIAVAACVDQGPHVDGSTARFRTDIGLTAEGSLFNSGLLLLDWQEVYASCILRDIRNANAKRPDLQQHRFADQNILNIMLEGAWCQLDPRWNMQTRLLQYLPEERPWIAHFCGKSKPWHAHCKPSLGRFSPAYWQLMSTAPELLPYTALSSRSSMRNLLRAKWDPIQQTLDALLARSFPWTYPSDVRKRVIDRPRRRQRAALLFAELVEHASRQQRDATQPQVIDPWF